MKVIILAAGQGFKLDGFNKVLLKDPARNRTILDLYLDTIRSDSGPFYVHCHGGTHRGGILGMAYRMYVQNWTYEKALIEFGLLGGSLMKDYKMIQAVRTYGKDTTDPEGS